MKTDFFSLSERSGLTNSHKQELWTTLQTAHCQAHRHYHTLAHLQTMLRLTDQFVGQLGKPDLVRWCIWFHDAVYKPLRSDNEQRSAALAVTHLQNTLPGNHLKTIEDFILATKNHEPADQSDLRYFLDFDLWILGQTPEEYQRYAEQVRQEFRKVPGLLYRRGRKKVLRHFLEQETIYQTETFRQRYEGSARQNLESELKSY